MARTTQSARMNTAPPATPAAVATSAATSTRHGWPCRLTLGMVAQQQPPWGAEEPLPDAGQQQQQEEFHHDRFRDDASAMRWFAAPDSSP